MLQRGLANEYFKDMHIPLAMQSVLCAYNASNRLVSSIKGTYIIGS